LIHIGLDDLMSALRTTRSRCLFGCGAAEGGDRAAKALRGALASPLLDQGALLKEARTVLVHLCGGEDLTLFEIELMMQSLVKHVPENAHVLFGAAVDPAMGNRLSVTVMSSLPEDSLVAATLDSLSRVDDRDKPLLDSGRPAPAAKPPGGRAKARRAPVTESAPGCEEESGPAAPAVPPDPVLADLFTEPAPVTEPQAEFPETSGEVVVTRFVSASGDGAVDDKQDDPPPMAVDAPMTGPETMPEAGPAAAVPDEAAAVRNPGPRPPKLKLGIKVGGSQSELSLDATPRGRFEGENPNVVDGEDLDLPPFLRKKK
jgi:cell division protein FtsZ